MLKNNPVLPKLAVIAPSSIPETVSDTLRVTLPNVLVPTNPSASSTVASTTEPRVAVAEDNDTGCIRASTTVPKLAVAWNPSADSVAAIVTLPNALVACCQASVGIGNTTAIAIPVLFSTPVAWKP